MPFGFAYTSEMWEWLRKNDGKFSGGFSVVDLWTYGRCRVYVDPRTGQYLKGAQGAYWSAHPREDTPCLLAVELH